MATSDARRMIKLTGAQTTCLPITTQGSFAVGSTASGMVGTTVGEDSKNA
jgi:hypothetical protein